MMRKTISTVAINDTTITRANVIIWRNGGNIEFGIMMSLQAELLLEKLHNGVAHFEFIKASTGERREAWGTLMQNLITAKVKGTRKGTNKNVIVFWDVEKGGFRSCLITNITKIY